MKEIVEHFGLGFLHMVSGAFMLVLFFAMLWNDGILNQVVVSYMGSICG